MRKSTEKVILAIVLLTVFFAMVPTIHSHADEKDAQFNPPPSPNQEVIRAIGVSAPNQDEYSARRSAKVIAMANLLGSIQSIFIERIIRVKGKGVVEDEIVARVRGTLVGATPCGSKYFPEQGYAKACVEIRLRGKGGLYEALSPFTFRKVQRGDQYELVGPSNFSE